MLTSRTIVTYQIACYQGQEEPQDLLVHDRRVQLRRSSLCLLCHLFSRCCCPCPSRRRAVSYRLIWGHPSSPCRQHPYCSSGGWMTQRQKQKPEPEWTQASRRERERRQLCASDRQKGRQMLMLVLMLMHSSLWVTLFCPSLFLFLSPFLESYSVHPCPSHP